MVYSDVPTFRTYTKIKAEDVSDSDATTFLTASEDEVKGLTGQDFSTSQSVTEYIDGAAKKNVSTSYNYVKAVPDALADKDYIMLSNRPVLSVDSIYILDRTKTFSKVYSYDGTTYNDNTTEANKINGTPFYVFKATPAQNNALYLSCGNRFSAFTIKHAAVGTGTTTVAVEYYNGSSWVAVSGLTNGTILAGCAFGADGSISFTLPTDWQKTDVNSINDYWIRVRLSSAGGYTVSPTLNQVFLNHDTVISDEENMGDIVWYQTGKVVFMASTVPDGFQNIKVTYSYGATAIPTYVSEMTALLAGIRALVSISSGNYNNKDSYSVGDVSISKSGKQVRINETILRYRERIADLMKLVGGRFNMATIN